MNKKLLLGLVVIFVLVAVISYTAYTGYFIANEETKKNDDRTVAVVSRVIDGDTVVLTDGTRVRLIGVDADERGERCYKEAKERMRQLVEGKNVVLEKDKTDKDRYGRLLRYIFVNDTFVDLILVREGLARVYAIKPDVKYLNQFEQAFLLARNENGCLWSS